MKLSKVYKKVIAYVCAITMVVTGVTYSPVKVRATTDWISVTNVPSGAWGGKKDMYQLGTTTDTSADGKWYLEVSQNEWGNWNGRYKNADSIEGFTFNNQTYNNAGGVFLWSTNLKSEFGLTAGTTYNMSVTISYTGVNKAQHNYVLTEGGNTNMNISRTVAAGASTETYEATVVPSANDFVLRISYTSSSYNTAEVGTFEVTDVTFTSTVPETTTAAPGTCVIGSDQTVGVWSYSVAQNEWSNEAASYSGETAVDGFTYNHEVYGWDGAYWRASDLKQIYSLIAGTDYTCTVTIAPLCTVATNIHVGTSGGANNLENTNKSGVSGTNLTWTGTVTPGADALVLDIGYGNNALGEATGAQVGGFRVVSVVFTAVEKEGTDCVIGTESTAGVWTYYVGQNDWNTQAARYENADAVDGFRYYHDAYNWDGAIWTASDLKDIYSLTEGTTYHCTITILPYCYEATNITVGTTGGSTNIDASTQSARASKLTWTGDVVPSSEELKLSVQYGRDDADTSTGAFMEGFKVVSVKFEEDKLAAPSSVAAYNFYAEGKGYQVVFAPTYSGAVSYNVYIDDNTTPVANILAADCESINVDKNLYSKYLDASVLSTYADDTVHNLYLATVDSQGSVSAKSKAAPVRITSTTTNNAIASHPTDISRVYITTNSATDIDTLTKATSKQNAALTIISANTSIIKNATYYGTVKLRGNSTSMADKKAYNISFDKKQTVLVNSAKGKKWCLLANAYEKTMMRNKLAMDFGKLMGHVATPEEQYVDVYLNGTYKGTYVLCEPADNGRGGVSYDEDGKDVLFEYEAERDETGEDAGVAYYATSKYGMRFVTEEFEDEVNLAYSKGYTTQNDIANFMKSNNSKFKLWTETLEIFESAMQGNSSLTVAQLGTYIDVDSFVDMYIINELFKAVDFTYSSVKFYVKYDANGENPVIYAGPLWDFDLSSGNAILEENRVYNENPLKGQQNRWFGALMSNTNFANAVKARYAELQPKIQNLYKDNGLGLSQIKQNKSTMNNSRIRNYTSVVSGGAGWSETVADGYETRADGYKYGYSTVSPYSTYTYDQHIEYLTTWLQNRNEYLCSTWGIDPDEYDSEYVPTVPTSSDLDITGYQMTAYFNDNPGTIGSRVVYQIGKTVNGQTPTEFGLIYGLSGYGNGLEDDDMVVGSTASYNGISLVQSYTATGEGNVNALMGASDSVDYYAFTMPTGTGTTAYFTATYYVRAYAKMSDDSYVYSDIYTFRAYDVADYLYQNRMLYSKASHDYIYDLVLKAVNSDYVAVDYTYDNKMKTPTKKG